MSPDPVVLYRGEGWYARFLSAEDLPAIEAVMQASLDFLELVSGIADSTAAAKDMLEELPPGKTLQDKLSIGIFSEMDLLVGVLDAIRDYPASGIWWIGLLQFRQEWRGRGLGAQVVAWFEGMACQAGVSEIRLGVVEPNQAGYRFWARMRFKEIERRLPRLFGLREQVVIVMRKGLVK